MLLGVYDDIKIQKIGCKNENCKSNVCEKGNK